VPVGGYSPVLDLRSSASTATEGGVPRLVALTMLIVLGHAANIAAQSRTTIVPGISVSMVHDDNLYSREQATGDYLTQFRPSLETTYETPTKRIEAFGSFDMQLSAKHSTLNQLDARRHAVLDSRFQTTPQLSFGFVGRYDKTDNPGELNFDSGVIIERQGAQRMELSPSTAYRIRPRTTISSQYTWTHESMAGSFEEQLNVGRVAVSRQTSTRTAWSVNYLGRAFTGGGQLPTHLSHSVLAGWTHQLSPATRLSVLAGPRSTSYRGITSEVLATFLRRTPASRIVFDYWHGETIVLGISGPVRVSSGSSKLNWTVRRNLELGTHLGVFRNTALDFARTHVYHASVIGAWNPSEKYIVAVSYGLDFQRGDIRSVYLNEARTRRGVFLVRLTVAPRFSRAADDPQLTPPVTGAMK
jgi:hypothetical protein